MRFTLTLHDYLSQYIHNITNEDDHCPVCYGRELQHDSKHDVQHVLDCYKADLLYRALREYKLTKGHNPDGDTLSLLIQLVHERVSEQMLNCCELLETRCVVD